MNNKNPDYGLEENTIKNFFKRALFNFILFINTLSKICKKLNSIILLIVLITLLFWLEENWNNSSIQIDSMPKIDLKE